MAEQSSTAAPAERTRPTSRSSAEFRRRPLASFAAPTQLRRRPQPGDRPRHRARRRCRRAPTSTPRSRPPSARSPAGATRRSSCARGRCFRFVELLEAALRGARAHRHDRARQDARRIARQRAARHRVRRGRVRRAVADDGLRPREHRRRTSTATSIRQPLGVVRRDRAVQLPGDGAAVVPAVRRRHAATRFVAQAVGAGAAVAAADVRAARAVRPAAGRRQPGQRRRARSSRRICDHPGHPRGVVRRLDAGGARASTSAPRTPASACRRSAARRTSSSSCPTPISTASIDIITESFYGCAGERCLAGSVLVPVGEAHARRAIGSSRPRAALKVGDGLEPGVADGAGDQRRAPRSRDAATSTRASHEGAKLRARRPRRRRSPDRDERLLRRADGVRRRVAADGDRPRGDLRPGGVDPRR